MGQTSPLYGRSVTEDLCLCFENAIESHTRVCRYTHTLTHSNLSWISLDRFSKSWWGENWVTGDGAERVLLYKSFCVFWILQCVLELLFRNRWMVEYLCLSPTPLAVTCPSRLCVSSECSRPVVSIELSWWWDYPGFEPIWLKTKEPNSNCTAHYSSRKWRSYRDQCQPVRYPAFWFLNVFAQLHPKIILSYCAPFAQINIDIEMLHLWFESLFLLGVIKD